MTYAYAYAPPSADVHVTGRRIVATIIDGIVLGLIFSAFRGAFGLPSGERTGMFGYTGLSGRANLAWLVVIAIYAFNTTRVQRWPPDGLTLSWFEKALHNTGARHALCTPGAGYDA